MRVWLFRIWCSSSGWFCKSFVLYSYLFYSLFLFFLFFFLIASGWVFFLCLSLRFFLVYLEYLYPDDIYTNRVGELSILFFFFFVSDPHPNQMLNHDMPLDTLPTGHQQQTEPRPSQSHSLNMSDGKDVNVTDTAALTSSISPSAPKPSLAARIGAHFKKWWWVHAIIVVVVVLVVVLPVYVHLCYGEYYW